MKYFVVFMFLLCLCAVGISWADEGHIGSIKTLGGAVEVIRQGDAVTPVAGTRLFTLDTVKTGHDGSAGIILQDDTIVSLGPDSELDMKEFRFDPQKKDFSLVCRMIRGTFVFITGAIGKLSPESVKVETPEGTIAVRGTKFAVQIKGR